MVHDVAVIGAGWAGLTAASQLQAAGLDVVVVEKARGPGGRSSTRRQNDFAFDHGAQYFTARSAAFRRQVAQWQDSGLVAEWQPQLAVFGQRPEQAGSAPEARLVGSPAMNAVLKHLAADLDCRFGHRVIGLEADTTGWCLSFERHSEPLRARHLLLTAPPRQIADLLMGVSELARQIAAVPMNPCWALMLAYPEPLAVDFDAAFDNEGPLGWLARNTSKPGRSGETWVLHADAEWSRQHLEDEADQVAAALLEAFHRRVPAARDHARSLVSAHRWRYALAPKPLDCLCLEDSKQRLTVAGDWCAGNRIEGAWLSGMAAGERILSAFA